jgi:hypothetical protein
LKGRGVPLQEMKSENSNCCDANNDNDNNVENNKSSMNNSEMEVDFENEKNIKDHSCNLIESNNNTNVDNNNNNNKTDVVVNENNKKNKKSKKRKITKDATITTTNKDSIQNNVDDEENRKNNNENIIDVITDKVAIVFVNNNKQKTINKKINDTRPIEFYKKNNENNQILDELKLLASKDRSVLEASSTAFMSFLKAYKEHLCKFIFQFEKLDIGSVARSYALLRLPKIPETRKGLKLKSFSFENSKVDTSKIAYKHVEKEKARINRINKKYNSKDNDVENNNDDEHSIVENNIDVDDDDDNNNENNDSNIDSKNNNTFDSSHNNKNNNLGSSKKNNKNDDNNSDNDNDDNSDENDNRTIKTIYTSKTTKSSLKTKKNEWLPVDEYNKKKQFENENEKRTRKKKQSFLKKMNEEWNELAAEEMAYKKLRKGKLSKTEYDKCFISDNVLNVDFETGDSTLLLTIKK